MAKKRKKQETLDQLLDEIDSGRAPGEGDGTDVVQNDQVSAVDAAIPDEQETDHSLKLSPRHHLEPLVKEQLVTGPNQLVARSSIQTVSDEPAAAIATMLSDIKNEFKTLNDNVLSQWQKDRDQLQSVIDVFIDAVGNSPNNAERPVIEGLVKLLDTKVNSGMLAVKMLEVKTKLLMAVKSSGNGVTINNQNVATAGQNNELVELLSTPLVSDFD